MNEYVEQYNEEQLKVLIAILLRYRSFNPNLAEPEYYFSL